MYKSENYNAATGHLEDTYYLEPYKPFLLVQQLGIVYSNTYTERHNGRSSYNTVDFEFTIESVTTRYGTYNDCLKHTVTLNQVFDWGQNSGVGTTWYCKGFGEVKSEWQSYDSDGSLDFSSNTETRVTFYR